MTDVGNCNKGQGHHESEVLASTPLSDLEEAQGGGDLDVLELDSVVPRNTLLQTEWGVLVALSDEDTIGTLLMLMLW